MAQTELLTAERGKALPAQAPDRPSAPEPSAPETHRAGRAGRRTQVRADRKDIQGLRAVAVGLVLLYHLAPHVAPGGFVGVDVFLVISGYLIIGSLGREVIASGTLSLRDFYARRIRRLLPASAFVLLVTLGATVLLMPMSRWRITAEGVVASALQVQNWALAMQTGYSAATEAVSPLQHYWSLAVEEQFYLVTPLLLLVAAWTAARLHRRPRRVLLLVVAAVLAGSFAHSVTFSVTHHDVAYFATSTRMWELALGGLLALLAPRISLPRWLSSSCTLLGLGAIAASALVLSTRMAFPGWVAALPVGGSALVLLGGQLRADGGAPGGAARLLGIRPLAYVGDVSYSLYLWHWPVIVFFVAQLHREPSAPEAVALAAVSLLLAVLSTRFVERPFRARRRAPRHAVRVRRRGRSAYALAASLVVVCVAAGAAPWLYVVHREQALGSQRLDAEHPGGESTLHEDPPGPTARVIPDPAIANADVPIVSRDDCTGFDPRKTAARGCVYGDKGSSDAVVLVGDSHAAQFSSALADVATERRWRLHVMVRNGCPFMAAPMSLDDGGMPNTDCADANELTRTEILELHPRVVVTSAMKPFGYERALNWSWSSNQALVDGYRQMWAPLVDAGIRVVVIRDTPTPTYSDPECVERHGPASTACAMSRKAGVDQQPDPLLTAARGMPGVDVVDLTDHFCNGRTCPGVVGNVLVYRDNHLTETFSLSLVPALARGLERVL